MPRAATAAARARLKALAATYADSASDEDAYSAASPSASGSSSDSIPDEGSSSDFDPPSEDDGPRKGKATKATPRGAKGKQRGGTPRRTEIRTPAKNSLGLSAAELRLLGRSAPTPRATARGGGGTGRVGVFPSGAAGEFVTRLEWEEETKRAGGKKRAAEKVNGDEEANGEGKANGDGEANGEGEANGDGEGEQNGDKGEGEGEGTAEADGDGEEPEEKTKEEEEKEQHPGWKNPLRARVTVEPCPSREERRERYRDLARGIGVLSPPENWEGEGWLPECYGAETSEGLPEGWSYRADVRVEVPLPAYEYMKPEDARDHVPGPSTRKFQYGPGAEIESLPLLGSKSFTSTSGASTGVMLNAGAPVWGLDWAPGSQHVAVSTCASDPAMGSRTRTKGSIQVWSAEGSCQVILCTEAEVCGLKWMPVRVRDEGTLGLVAAAQLDGTVAIYAVPTPQSKETVYVRAKALTSLDVDDATAMCIDWISGGRVAVGLSNGHIGTWNVLHAVRTNDPSPLPDTYTPVALAAISSLCVARVPPVDSEAEPQWGGDPYLVIFSSYDGSTGLLDLRDPAGTLTFCRSRIPCASVSFSPQNAAPLYIDSDYMVVMAQLRSTTSPGTFILAPNRAPVLSLSCSDYHPMVAAAAADGALTISSSATGFFRRKGVGLFFLRVYEVDWSERGEDVREAASGGEDASGGADAAGEPTASEPTAGESTSGHPVNADVEMASADGGVIRVTDSFMPDHSTIEATNKRKDENRDDTAVKTAAWDREVGLHCVAWQNGNGLRHAGWIASAGWTGIVRVEEIRGSKLWREEWK